MRLVPKKEPRAEKPEAPAQPDYRKTPAYGHAAKEPEPQALHKGLKERHRDGFL